MNHEYIKFNFWHSGKEQSEKQLWSTYHHYPMPYYLPFDICTWKDSDLPLRVTRSKPELVPTACTDHTLSHLLFF
jgi:hypothetical protein